MLLFADGELLNRSVENREVRFDGLLNVTGPAMLFENRSKGMSMLGVLVLLASFSGDVASDD